MTISLRSIREAVSESLAISRGDLRCHDRSGRIVLGRALISYLARKLGAASFLEIAAELGRRSHAASHDAERRISRMVADDARIDFGSGPIRIRELLIEIEERARWAEEYRRAEARKARSGRSSSACVDSPGNERGERWATRSRGF